MLLKEEEGKPQTVEEDGLGNVKSKSNEAGRIDTAFGESLDFIVILIFCLKK